MPGLYDRSDPSYANSKRPDGTKAYQYVNGVWMPTESAVDPDTGNTALGQHASAGHNIDPATGQPKTSLGANINNGSTLNDGSGPQLQGGSGVEDVYAPNDFNAGDAVLRALGLQAAKIDPNAPGGHLDTTDADADKSKLSPLIQQLLQQQQTGGGAWQSSLDKATQQSEAQAQALGQSQTGVGGMTALRNIGNARAGAAQTEAGQANILSNQAKNDATNQLASLQSGIAGQDAGQASTAAGVNQGVTEANNALLQNAKTNVKNLEGAAGQAIGTAIAASDGGRVPGKPRVFGDDSRNDTVPAMLSPGEIVIPRSHAGTPEQAAAFVAAVKARGGRSAAEVQHLAPGGPVVPSTSGYHDPWISNYGGAPVTMKKKPGEEYDPNASDANGIGWQDPAAAFNPFTPTQAGTVENGALLNLDPYNASRTATLQNTQQYAPWNGAPAPAGSPSAGRQGSAYEQNAANVSNQQLRNTSDANMAKALVPQGRGGLGSGDALNQAIFGTQRAAGDTGSAALGAQQQASQNFANAILKQRAQDQSVALAKQQAAFKNTQMNAGVTLQNQQALKGLLGGAAQGFAQAASVGRGQSYGDPSTDNQYGPGGGAPAWSDPSSTSSPDQWNSYPSSDSGGKISIDDGGKAHGGVIGVDEEQRANDFVRALQRSKR